MLGRIRYRGDTFVVERNGEPVARVIPLPDRPGASLAEAVAAWRECAPPDPAFARDLEEVGAADLPPEDPWHS